MARIQFGWQHSRTLTYGAYEPDGTERVAPGQSLPEIETNTGYYTVDDANVLTGDTVIIKEGAFTVGYGEADSYIGAGATTLVPSGYIGDFKLGETFYFNFSTTQTLSGGSLLVYLNNDTGEIIPSQATLVTDFDSKTNIHNVSVVLVNTSYTKEEDYSIILSGATIGSETVTAVVATFSIENRWQSHRNRWTEE